VQARLVSFAGGRWGVLRLDSFRLGAAVVLRREVRQLQRDGAQGFVLDLRDNPGGLVAQAVAVASLFVDRGVIATLAGAHHPRQVLRASPGVATRLPLVVLVDRYTASSAEIVAAALRDNHRAAIVGERTYGKGLVQAVDPLGNGAALELTIAQYRTPDGADLAGRGLTPQVRGRRPADATGRGARRGAPCAGAAGELKRREPGTHTTLSRHAAPGCATREDPVTLPFGYLVPRR
jgi:carboxyl-terminal processing protease